MMMPTTVDTDGELLMLDNRLATKVLKEPNGETVTNVISRIETKPLFVFVTATLVDPAGKPIHDTDAPARDRK